MSANRHSYRISVKARQDLEAVWVYTFQTWSSKKADEYHGDLIDSFSDLASRTRRGRKIDTIRHDYWLLAVGSHFVVYRWRGDTVLIVRILHQRMNIGAHL